ncbi:testis-expressed protein 47-like isoform X1 [Tubulanus polymorphus]|uniref:testis-expressed protein 47-like isoform X1 n=1 Tax=Tubulanus polymorphus TaxID=672921 RepID=UPI003DA4E150
MDFDRLAHDEEDTFIDSRTSLLDIVEDKIRAQNKKNLVHRTVILSKLQQDVQEKDEISGYYDRLFKNALNSLQGEPVSGLLLIYPEYCLHIVELRCDRGVRGVSRRRPSSSSDMLVLLFKDLLENERKKTGFMEKSRILVISHDIPTRSYSGWNSRVLDIQSQNIALYEPSDSTDKLIVDVLNQLLKLGNFLSKTPKLNFKNTLDTLREKVPEFIPQQLVVGYLAETDDQCMTNLDDITKIYSNPFDFTMQGELVWPLPVRLFPYN